MSVVADRARFQLERSVPQLREWEDRELFSKEEIRAIVQKRTDLEHRCCTPAAPVADFQATIEWEKHLEKLRLKRCYRHKIRKLEHEFTGQYRIVTLYERALTLHPGSRDLWVGYLDYTESVNMNSRWRKVMTRALRMRPMDADLWASCARRFIRQGDMVSARQLFMRGCRFCTANAHLWLEYTRSELDWLSKLENKKALFSSTAQNNGKVNAADPIASSKAHEDDVMAFSDNDDDDDVLDEDGMIKRDDPLLPSKKKSPPSVFGQEVLATLENKETTHDEDEETNPALSGAIPIAIFDAASQLSFFQAETAQAFYQLLRSFSQLPQYAKIANHYLAYLETNYPDRVSTFYCQTIHPLGNVPVTSARYATNLRQVLQNMQATLDKTKAVPSQQRSYCDTLMGWIDFSLQVPAMDAALKTVLESTKLRLQRIKDESL